jgi:hypothetical protein
MSTRLARAIVRAAAAVLPDPSARGRYREQWTADVEGATEIGMSPLPVALGAAAAAIRLAASDRRSVTRLLPAPLLTGASDRRRRSFGIVQLAVATPYLWAVLFYGYARLLLGVSHGELVGTPYDPKDLIVDWLPLYWIQGFVMVWLALGGWAVAAALAPVGLVYAIGGQRSARWLPMAGTIAAVAVILFAASDFGASLRTWILD